MSKHEYFVSCLVKPVDGSLGFGNFNIDREEKIKSMDDIREIEEEIKEIYEKEGGVETEGVNIMNYKLF